MSEVSEIHEGKHIFRQAPFINSFVRNEYDLPRGADTISRAQLNDWSEVDSTLRVVLVGEANRACLECGKYYPYLSWQTLELSG